VSVRFSLDYFVRVLFAFVVIGLVSSLICREIGWEERLLSDLFCGKWDVKPVNRPVEVALLTVCCQCWGSSRRWQWCHVQWSWSWIDSRVAVKTVTLTRRNTPRCCGVARRKPSRSSRTALMRETVTWGRWRPRERHSIPSRFAANSSRTWLVNVSL